MKLTLYGWNRRVTIHNPEFQPVTNIDGFLHPEPSGTPLVFTSRALAYGKLTDLALTGDFAVEFRFSPADLKSWIRKCIQEDQPAAARLLIEMLTEAFPTPAESNRVADGDWN